MRTIRSLSIYFFAGDFADVLRRHEEGRAQLYGTHNEVARLVKDLRDLSIEVRINSFCTPERNEQRPRDGVVVRSLGGRRFDDDRVLAEAIDGDDADALIPHFPNVRLLNAVAAKRNPAAAFLATSFYRKGPRSWLRKRRTVAALNRPEFEIVSNHCLPATEHLAELGVDCGKLVPWDVPHPFTPEGASPKLEAPSAPFEVFYAGAINEEKGVGDVIQAIPQLKAAGPFRFVFAGNGEIEAMLRLARSLGVESRVEFIGGIPNPQVFDRFQAADLLVVPSRPQFQEGFPLTMFEAIASHTPIVCSDHPIFERAMADGVNAMLFAAGNPSSLASAIDRLLADRALYLRLSRASERSWSRLEGPADWRRLIVEWVRNGPSSSWIQDHKLDEILRRRS